MNTRTVPEVLEDEVGAAYSEIMVDSFQQFLAQLSHRVKVVRFGVFTQSHEDAWGRLIGMFSLGQPVSVEDWLDQRGAEELVNDF